MSLLTWIFGKKETVHQSGRWSWTEHGAWIDLRKGLGNDYVADLGNVGRAIAQLKSGEAFMADMFSLESAPQQWGRTDDEVHRQFGRDFMGQLQFLQANQGQSNVFGDFSVQGAFGGLIKDLPAIVRSMEERTFRFVMGTTANGCRAVGLLVFGSESQSR